MRKNALKNKKIKAQNSHSLPIYNLCSTVLFDKAQKTGDRFQFFSHTGKEAFLFFVRRGRRVGQRLLEGVAREAADLAKGAQLMPEIVPVVGNVRRELGKLK
jgi:hypothetical protein